MKVGLNVEVWLDIPEDIADWRKEKQLKNSIRCGVENALEHSIDDETILDWLPTGITVELNYVNVTKGGI